MVGRKHNAKGRSTGKLTGKVGRFTGPPTDEYWAWLPVSLLNSSAWRAMSSNTRRLIDFLLLEHCRHAGLENGNLMAPYRQLIKYGLSGRLIFEAIEEGEFLGLIRCIRGAYRTSNEASRYRLTWIGERDGPPTNEWKAVTDETIQIWKYGRRNKRRERRDLIEAKKQDYAPICGSTAHSLVVAQNVQPLKTEKSKA